MTDVHNLKAELAGLTLLKGRTPKTPASEKARSIVRIAPYRDGAIFLAKFSGTSNWERHPNGDEIVQVVEGETTLHLITPEGPHSFTLSAGMLVVVPRNAWHKFESEKGVSVMTATPQPTEHVDVEDPRTL
ncbi:MAG TPA: cupin domain-containing protein [Stellaceae bacterium]|nr:cupin domain-containing protein [Stellaceae bacterium]